LIKHKYLGTQNLRVHILMIFFLDEYMYFFLEIQLHSFRELNLVCKDIALYTHGPILEPRTSYIFIFRGELISDILFIHFKM